MTTNTKALIDLKKETADIVLQKIKIFQRDKELDLPSNYSAANALKSAWLILQETKDRNNNLALDICTKASIANALLNMVIQGLNPAKKQCYFIVRGKTLCLDRSYFGEKTVALRVAPDLDDIYAEVIYAGDEFVYSIKHGMKYVEKHTQKFGNINDENMAGVYATAVDKDGNDIRSEVMTMDQLLNAWKKSQIKELIDENGKIKPGSVHAEFKSEMAKRSVTKRLSKHIINASDDKDLLVQSVRESDAQLAEAEAEVEIADEANQNIIDIEKVDNGKVESPGIDTETVPSTEEQTKDSEYIPPGDDEPSAEEQEDIRQSEMEEAGPAF